MSAKPAMDDASIIALRETDQGVVPEPMMVHVKLTDIFGEESLCFVTYDRNPANVAGLQRFGTPCTVM